jgi:hypothetical protein
MPTLPIIAIYTDYCIDIIYSFSLLEASTLYAFSRLEKDNCIYFDRNGDLWKMSAHSKKYDSTPFIRFISVFYKPSIEISIRWYHQGNFSVEQLKENINDCIDKDDDVLTQFINSETLKLKIYKSSSFDEVTNVLNNYVFKPDFEKIEATTKE